MTGETTKNVLENYVTWDQNGSECLLVLCGEILSQADVNPQGCYQPTSAVNKGFGAVIFIPRIMSTTHRRTRGKLTQTRTDSITLFYSLRDRRALGDWEGGGGGG